MKGSGVGIPNPDPEKGPGFMTIGHDAVLPTPRYMLAPGADGYRTPTIEDIEQHSSSTNHDDLLPGSSLSHAFSALTSRLPVKGNLAERSKLGLRLEVEHIHWKRRIRHFTWSYFTLTMATGGIANCLWSTQYFQISEMTPLWTLPNYPLIIIGPHAGLLSSTLRPSRALDIIVVGTTLQGIGFMLAMTIYSAFIYRLMTQKLPAPSSRPGMFVSVGPSGFTATALITMAQSAERALASDYMGDGHLTAMILRVVANWTSLGIWGLALWFFLISVGAHYSCIGKMTFQMTWYSFVFPNTALITATFAIGKAFGSSPIQVIGCVMTCLLIVVWFMVFGCMIRAIILKRILWPQKGEDKDEGGFTGPLVREKSRGNSVIRKTASTRST
ncbi:hypothetical protein MMC09_004464 [Bachmanniomyces sp. S44760]|nr:hypothetical protein [Bachmanniomyces sp. S44760]